MWNLDVVPWQRFSPLKQNKPRLVQHDSESSWAWFMNIFFFNEQNAGTCIKNAQEYVLETGFLQVHKDVWRRLDVLDDGDKDGVRERERGRMYHSYV